MTPEDQMVYETIREHAIILEARGFAPLSPFWDETLRLWYESGLQRFAAEVGRRGGKSLTSRRVAIAEAIARDWPIPEGERGIYAYISAGARHARRRVREIARMLTALGHPIEVALSSGSGEVRMLHRPIDFVVFACNTTAVIGDLWIGMIADEMARWKDDERANPAREVIATARPSLASMRVHGARDLWISSPLAERGLFHETVRAEEGEPHPDYPDAWFRLDRTRMVVHAPTWVAHPGLTKELTHEEEPDIEIWRREYLAEPMPKVASAGLDPRLINWLDTQPKLQAGDQVVAGADLALKRDASALVIAIKRGNRYLIVHVEEWRAPLELTKVCVDIKERLSQFKASTVFADQHYRERLREVLRESRLFVNDATDGVNAIIRLRDLLRERRIDVYMSSDRLKSRLVRQLDDTEIAITSSGRQRVIHPRTDHSHGDIVEAFAHACWQEAGIQPIARERPKFTEKQIAMAREVQRRKRRLERAGKKVAMW